MFIGDSHTHSKHGNTSFLSMLGLLMNGGFAIQNHLRDSYNSHFEALEYRKTGYRPVAPTPSSQYTRPNLQVAGISKLLELTAKAAALHSPAWSPSETASPSAANHPSPSPSIPYQSGVCQLTLKGQPDTHSLHAKTFAFSLLNTSS